MPHTTIINAHFFQPFDEDTMRFNFCQFNSFHEFIFQFWFFRQLRITICRYTNPFVVQPAGRGISMRRVAPGAGARARDCSGKPAGFA
jgi:hypothetical protein